MVGKPDFGLKEWKELMKDSLKTSVWFDGDDAEKRVMDEWSAQYKTFVRKILKDFSGPLEEEKEPSL